MPRPTTFNEGYVWRERGFNDGYEGKSKEEGMAFARKISGDKAASTYLTSYRRGAEKRAAESEETHENFKGGSA